MTRKQSAQDLQQALRTIKTYQDRHAADGRWRLDIPVWRLALEGLLVFGLAFVCGLGMGVFYQVLTGG
ncbi:MAG: hypothetical protein V1918_09280 [Planctomycetota bacterium]